MSRGDQLFRQWSILQSLSSGRKSRRELAATFSVSRKTITRDIETLSLFPVVEERIGKDVFYSLLDGAQTPNIWLQADEIAALLMVRATVLHALEGSPYHDTFASVLTKIEHAQKEHAYRKKKELPEVFLSGFSKPSIRSDFQEMLTQAAIEHQVVWMRYFTASRQETNERKVEPYILHLHPHGFHLIAYCLHREAFLRFNINLIQEARLLPQRFDAKSRCFDLKQFLSEGFDQHRSKPILDVHIRIKYPTAHWAKDQFYHTTQVIEERSDGVEIRFRSEGSEAIMARILSLGEDCEVLAPPSLRRKVQGKASNIRDLYPE